MAENNRKTICVCCIFLQRMISGFLHWVRNLLSFRVILAIFAGIMYFAALAIGGCFVYRTFCYKDNYVPESINININDEKGKKKELSAEGKAYLKEQLHSALMEVSREAESAYNEKFATLLTILSIFGIAWPLTLSLLQNMEFRKELDKLNKVFQEQKEDQSDDFHKLIEQLFSDFQTQKKEQSENTSQQKDQIDNLSIECYKLFAFFLIDSVTASGIEHIRKNATESGERIACLTVDSKQVTYACKKLVYALDFFCRAERVKTSGTKTDKILNLIKKVSCSIYNLIWNYSNVNCESLILSNLDKSISFVESLDQQRSYVKEALDYLEKAKDLLKSDNEK